MQTQAAGGLNERRVPPAWLVGASQLPFGVTCGFVITALPFLLTKAGVSVDRVATVSATVMSPTFWGFLVTPLVDVGFSRRTYVLLTAAISACCVFGALWRLTPSHLGWFTALLLVGELSIVVFSNASAGWMSEFVPDETRGRVGGWINAANLGAGALGAMISLELAEKFALPIVGLVLAASIFLPVLTVLWFPAPHRPKLRMREILSGTLRNVWQVSKTRECLLGFALFLSPASCAAAINLFSGLGKDFRTDPQWVIWVTGAGCAISSSIGALVGGYLADRIRRSSAYLFAGISGALIALAMAFVPHGPASFTAGVLAYNATAGISYAAFTALGLQLVGKDHPAASTQFALFGAAANGAIVYMTWVDGQGYRLFGARGLLFVDALASLCAATILLLVLRRAGRLVRAV
ncbi:MAG TPA: MFS transporter [Bryobacteraceae bacterium]|nr:MFS transporter [Bryobacteraceae bacterium]